MIQDIKEVQDRIKTAKDKTWFKTIEAGFDYTHLEEKVEKIGFLAYISM